MEENKKRTPSKLYAIKSLAGAIKRIVDTNLVDYEDTQALQAMITKIEKKYLNG